MTNDKATVGATEQVLLSGTQLRQTYSNEMANGSDTISDVECTNLAHQFPDISRAVPC